MKATLTDLTTILTPSSLLPRIRKIAVIIVAPMDNLYIYGLWARVHWTHNREMYCISIGATRSAFLFKEMGERWVWKENCTWEKMDSKR